MSNRAWVTLATNDSYGLGALVLAHSLRRVHTIHPTVVLITPSVTDAMRERLRAAFAQVVTVDVLDSRDAAHLSLLQRPELGITFTKIHCWELQYEKCVFLDADTLVVQNCDELFEREELSAAPDVGWPDCFNSGVFVFKPSQETFYELIKFAEEQGSFDGGDQGLLNSFFSDWARGDINKHLPFLYNVTSAAFYSYLPALKHYGQDLKIIHFIGNTKPWLQKFDWESRSVDAPEHLKAFLQLWWDLFVGQVHSHLDVAMSGVAGNLARVVPGSSGVQREALDELTRRQGWEAGNIDYLGADSFDNIWAKISTTLNQPRTSPPKQLTPPPKEPSPSKEPSSVNVAEEAAVVDAPVSEAAVVSTTSPTPIVAKAPAESEPVVSPAVVESAVESTVVAVAPVVEAPKAAVQTSQTPIEIPATVEVAAEVPASDIPATVEAVASTPVEAPAAPIPTQATAKPSEIPATVEASTPGEALAPIKVVSESPKVKPTEKTELPVLPPLPASPESTLATAAKAAAAASPVPEPPITTPEKATKSAESSTDSPPLANTPSKDAPTALPDAKSTEEAAQETRL